MPLFISSFLRVLGDGRGIGNAWADRSVCRASSRQGPLQIMTKNDHVNHLIFLSSPCVRLQGEGVGWCLAPSVRIPTLLAPSSSRRRWSSRQGRAKKSRKHCRPLVSLLRGLLNETRRAGLSVNRRRRALERGAGETDLLASLHELV